MLKLTDKEKKEISVDGVFYYTTDEMTDAYNNGERGLLKARMNFYTNATVFGKKFTVRDNVTDAEAEEDSSYIHSNGIKETNFIDGWTGYFYSLFKKGAKDVLLRSDVFKVGKMNAYSTENTENVREILVPLTKEFGEDESEWVLDTEMVKSFMGGIKL